MANGVATDHRLNRTEEVEQAVTDVLASPCKTHARMVFVGSSPRTDTLQAVVAWPKPQPLLTDVCALFEHFGLQVARQRTLTVNSSEPVEVSLFDFAVPTTWRPASAAKVAAAFEARAVHGFTVDDFASLIIRTQVNWRDVTLLRSASRYLRQAGLGFSPSYVVATLNGHPRFVAALVNYFTARFDPDIEDRTTAVAAALAELTSQIEATTSLDEDRILRTFTSFVSATLRTNWFQQGPDGGPKRHASFVLDSNALDRTGSIVPFREIFVDSNDVEGIHARNGLVARGGLRFSDRPEDYRTEVLGLMKTQSVKNSPIVPVGAKGAFVRKNPAITPETAYRTFISGLLDVTDNIVDGQPHTPSRTVTYGDEDSYLVVAADKGTARFSDVANELAIDRGFWLGDAFASGGSSGYDHKKMGITARGAWVSVRRHFADLGIDADTDPIRVAGIGDMSGDVFGNGMLLSRHLKLVAAFDHRHVFLDPEPKPAASYTERQRLATLSSSSWADFDRAVISRGGGVWSRTDKIISLPPEARALLGLTSAKATPNDVIRAILTADVDLLWNGGIGTYVKSARETHTDAADRANDAIRINADQLRATVIGEGGNLGLTQRARIDFALAGGRINADFIDNAAGVATSDREVNLKIALDSAVRRGSIALDERDGLLEASQEEVAAAVLDVCENQVLAITLAEAQAAQLLNRHERLIDNLERVSGISRIAEILPNKKELVSRTRSGRGLTRPEIAVLMAHSKNVVRDELLTSEVPDESIFTSALLNYFPGPIRRRSTAEIESHQLAREIISTQIADDLINHVGPGLIYQLDERLGVPTPAVAAAYAVVRELFGVDARWAQARGVQRDPQRCEMLHEVQQFIEHTAARLLRHQGGRIDITSTIQRYRGHVDALGLTDRIAESHRDRILLEAFDLSHTAARLNMGVELVAEAFLSVDEKLDLSWITRGLVTHTASTWWDAMSAAAVRDQLANAHHRLTAAVLHLDAELERALSAWQQGAAIYIERFAQVRAELGRDSVIDVARAATVHAELVLLCRQTEAL